MDTTTNNSIGGLHELSSMGFLSCQRSGGVSITRNAICRELVTTYDQAMEMVVNVAGNDKLILYLCC